MRMLLKILLIGTALSFIQGFGFATYGVLFPLIGVPAAISIAVLLTIFVAAGFFALASKLKPATCQSCNMTMPRFSSSCPRCSKQGTEISVAPTAAESSGTPQTKENEHTAQTTKNESTAIVAAVDDAAEMKDENKLGVNIRSDAEAESVVTRYVTKCRESIACSYPWIVATGLSELNRIAPAVCQEVIEELIREGDITFHRNLAKAFEPCYVLGDFNFQLIFSSINLQDSEVRQYLIETLYKWMTKNESAFNTIVAACSDPVFETRLVTISYLAGDVDKSDNRSIGYSKWNQPLKGLTDEQIRIVADIMFWIANNPQEDHVLRTKAKIALQKFEDPRLVDISFVDLKSDDPATRLEAVSSLIKLDPGLKTTIGALETAAKDSDWKVRLAVVQGVSNNKEKALELSIPRLLDEHEAVRSAAIQNLKFSNGDEQTQALLLDAFGDSKIGNRIAALESLSLIHPDTALDLCIRTLSSDIVELRRAAANTIKQFKDSRALKALELALSDSDKDVRISAIRALLEIDDKAAAEILISIFSDPIPYDYLYLNSSEFHRALVCFQKYGLLPKIFACLYQEESELARTAALKCLSSGNFETTDIDSSIIDRLAIDLSDDSVQIKTRAAELLGRTKDDRAIEVLLKFLECKADTRTKDTDLVRSTVLAALGEIGGERAIEALIASLTSGSESVFVRVRCITSLQNLLNSLDGDIEQTAGFNAILDATSDGDGQIRVHAVRALGTLKLASTYQTLEKMVDDKDPQVRKEAISALGELGDSRASDLIAKKVVSDPIASVKEASISALRKIGSNDTATLDALTIALKNKADSVRYGSSYAVEELTGLSTREFLEGILVDREKSWKMREVAAHALAKNRYAHRCTLGLADEKRAVRNACAIILVRNVDLRLSSMFYDEDKMLEFMELMIAEPDENLRAGVAKILGDLRGEKGVKLLVRGLKDESVRVRVCSAIALNKIKNPLAVESLIETYKREKQPIVRQNVVEALGEIRDPRAIETLCEALTDETQFVRAAAAISLSKIPSTSAVDPLIQRLKDELPVVRKATLKALSKIDDERAWEAVEKAQQSLAT